MRESGWSGRCQHKHFGKHSRSPLPTARASDLSQGEVLAIAYSKERNWKSGKLRLAGDELQWGSVVAAFAGWVDTTQ